MATVVLTVAGGLIGGPVGAAIGAAAGNVFDREVLLKPKGREGPRLSELRVQTSSYGTQIPKLFGTMRVAGSVIWATDLIEHRARASAGKGQPSTTSYSYSSSFAVALSARAILGVGRIWADGMLLRGSAGDFKVTTGFRLHLGSEDQAVDPLIAAAEGAAAPAHRGIAYAVFENLALGEFGNRLPSLSFEVFAGAAQVGAILATLSEGAIASEGDEWDGGLALGGFAASGASVRAVAEMLTGAAGNWVRAEPGRLVLAGRAGAVVAVQDAGVEAARGTRSIAASDTAPRTLSLTHFDPARDFQAGLQRAVRPGAGTREARLELPASVDAGLAKTIAEDALLRLDLERERRSVALPWSAMTLRPGERVTIAGAPGLWRVDRWMLEKMVVTIECVRVAAGSLAASADPGRVLPAPDRAAGTTIVHAFELPPLGDALATGPRLAIAAAGSAPGWRSAALLVSSDGGGSWTSAGSTGVPAVLGQLVTPLVAAPAALEDRHNAIEIDLAHAEMLLADADAAGLAAGANAAMVGDELLQFGRAEPLGGTRWRLRRLWRGRRGSQTGAMPGARFVLLDADALIMVELPRETLGGTMQILAQGAGDAGAPAPADAALKGISCLPPAPVHFTALQQDDGATLLRWVRRSRTGWAWSDGIDAPLGEEREAYRVTLGTGEAFDIDAPWLLLAPGHRAVPLGVTVCQAGANGLSPPLSILLPPLEGSDD